MNNSIYLDYQASTPTSNAVLKAMEPFWQSEFANPHSGEHACGWAANAAIENALDQIADPFGFSSGDVIVTSGATEANNLAILGYALKQQGIGKSARIIVSSIEHKSILAPAEFARETFKADVKIIGVQNDGRVDINALEADLKRNGPALVSIGWVNGEIGTIQPLKEIGSLCRATGSLLHTDAAQAIAATDISELWQFADLVSISGHKCYGPKGIGALLGHPDALSMLSSLSLGGGQQQGHRSGTLATPLVVGLGQAVEDAGASITANSNALARKSQYLLYRLCADLRDLQLIGPETNRHSGNLNIRISGVDAKDLIARLQPKLAFSSGSACASGTEAPSHVLRAIGLPIGEAKECFRISVGLPTTIEEIDSATEILLSAAQDIISATPMS